MKSNPEQPTNFEGGEHYHLTSEAWSQTQKALPLFVERHRLTDEGVEDDDPRIIALDKKIFEILDIDEHLRHSVKNTYPKIIPIARLARGLLVPNENTDGSCTLSPVTTH